MIEDEVKNFFSTENQAIKTYLQQNLNYHDDFQIISECKIHHGLQVDKIILDDRGRYLSLIECKCDVGTTEFVRGIGQIYQYKAQALHELKDRMAPVHSVVLSFPNNINTRDTPVQVEHLQYPAQSHLFIINQSNKSYKSINTSDRSFGNKNKYFGEKLISISPFYFRDNTFAEYFIGLHVLNRRSIQGNRISRNLDDIMRICNTHNPGNARNVGITLSSLGFIDGSNRISPKGFKYLSFDYPDFVESLSYEFAYPYINTMFAVINNNLQEIENKDQQRKLVNELWELRQDQQIEFLTESSDTDKTRYIGSWNYVLSRSLQCISFTPRKTDFSILYDPTVGLPSISEKIRTNIPLEIQTFLSIKDTL